MNKTIFIATVLAAATLLAAGLVVFPGSVQEAQARDEGIGSLIIHVHSNDNDDVPLGELPLPLPSE
jgi:hypothetical protein